VTCPVCSREVVQLTSHHIIPRVKGGKNGPTIDICFSCHGQIHMLFRESELSRMSWDDLLRTEQMVKWIGWIAKKSGHYKHRMSNRRRRRR